jgi:excisionase family DNA binding protein
MTGVYYRTGAAAKLLAISTYELRRLAESGLIEAEYNGSQWRFPVTEVERLLKAGVPPIPASDAQADPQLARRPRAGTNGGGAGLLGPPSQDLVASTEELVATENLLKRRKLDQELEQVEDWFRERETEEEERLAADEREEQARLAEEQAQREHNEWVRVWEAHALDLVPEDAPIEIRLAVHEAVRAKLLALDPVPAHVVTQQIVEALVARLLAPWHHEKNLLVILIEARDTMLPAEARRSTPPVTVWQSRAIQAAAEAIQPLPTGASSEQIRAAAKQAVAAVIQEFDHDQHSERLVHDLWLQLRDATGAELETARNEVVTALAGLPPSASERDREATRDAAIAPIRKAIAQRQAVAESERQRIQAEAEAERQRIQTDRQAAEARLVGEVLASQARGDHNSDKRAILIGLFTMPLDMLGALTPEARAAVSDALDQLPVGAAWDEMVQAKDAALKPFIALHEQRQQKAQVIASALRELPSCLRTLQREWDFEGATVEDLAQEFHGPVRAGLEKAITGQEQPDQIARLVRRLVERQLSASPAPALA